MPVISYLRLHKKITTKYSGLKHLLSCDFCMSGIRTWLGGASVSGSLTGWAKVLGQACYLKTRLGTDQLPRLQGCVKFPFPRGYWTGRLSSLRSGGWAVSCHRRLCHVKRCFFKVSGQEDRREGAG